MRPNWQNNPFQRQVQILLEFACYAKENEKATPETRRGIYASIERKQLEQ